MRDPIGKFTLKPFTGLRNIPIMIAEVEPACCPKCQHWQGYVRPNRDSVIGEIAVGTKDPHENE